MTFFQNNFSPSAKIIRSITNTSPAIVVTDTPHGYDDGYIVRLVVPKNAGMQQINGQLGKITNIALDTFSIDIDASGYDPFAYTSLDQIAQVIPVGSSMSSILQPEENANNIIPEN